MAAVWERREREGGGGGDRGLMGLARGAAYEVTPEEVEAFHRDGFVHLRGVLADDEVVENIEGHYTAFMTGEVLPEGKDLCDMSGATGRSRDEFTLYNAMLPRRYKPDMQGNLFEKRAASIVDQLYADKEMAIDYDQILAKRPQTGDSIFAWHQDMAYWPPLKASPATATVWLALDASTRQNGCMRFIPGSHKEPLRPHRPVKMASSGRLGEESSHALMTDVDEEKEGALYVEISRGDVTVHNESVIHGSGSNSSNGWRRAYVLAFRTAECVAEERALGFSHSHNDNFNWDAFRKWDEANAAKKDKDTDASSGGCACCS